MPNYKRNKSSVETELNLRVVGKRLKEDLCVSIECFVGVVFLLNRVFLFRLGPK